MEIMSTNKFCILTCILGVMFSFVSVNVNCCCVPELDQLLSELFPSICPLVTGAKALVKDLFETQNVEEEDGLITPEVITECLRYGRELSQRATKRGNQLVRSGIDLDDYSPSLVIFFSGVLPEDFKKASDRSLEMLSATKLLQLKVCSRLDITPDTFMSLLENQVIHVLDPVPLVPASTLHTKSKYRTIDGSYNNLQNPQWGRRGAPLTRIATPRYADGIYAMPVAKSGRPLPNPRLISTLLFRDRIVSSRVLSHMNMQWGQYMTHDMLFQSMEVTDEGGIQCCVGEGIDVLPPELLNDKCIPICVPDDDPFYAQHGIKCLNLVRSLTTPKENSTLGPAQQANTVTSFLDGSALYGTDKKVASEIRTKVGGKLREERRKGAIRGFLPTTPVKSSFCDLRNSSEPCYFAGDRRVNQNPTLAMLQTLLLREHNRVADILSSLNPSWDDEKLYQEARRIVVAEIQHITYQEWLPLNFGESYYRRYRISPKSLYSYDYNENVNPGAINSFGTGAFRFLHTTVPNTILTCPASYNAAYLYKLSDHYLNPSLLELTPDSFDDVVRGVLAHSCAESDPYYTGEISNLLFKSSNPWGMDLVAMDIQRGRDHGLASYNDYREVCGLRRARTFQDLAGEINQDRIKMLAYLYESVDDIDLLVGGAMERNFKGSIFGHTFHCITAEQFYRTRVGDRFFYDHGDMPHSFTPDQLKEIKKTSMARLICDNTDGVYYVQRKAFELESPSNPKYRCDDYNAIPYMDLTPWKKCCSD